MQAFMIFAAGVLLTACAHARKPPAPPPLAEQSARYLCADGRAVELLFGGDGSAVLTLADGAAIPLVLAPAASGARYVGGGWQWWGKGLTHGELAQLAPGETLAAAGGVGCRVR